MIPILATHIVTATAASNAALTLTLPAPGVGLFHLITFMEIRRTSTALLNGNATLVVTSTNLPGDMAWSFGNAVPAGATQLDFSSTFFYPIKSLVENTATTIVMPAPGAAVRWRAYVVYFIAAA